MKLYIYDVMTTDDISNLLKLYRGLEIGKLVGFGRHDSGCLKIHVFNLEIIFLTFTFMFFEIVKWRKWNHFKIMSQFQVSGIILEM